MDLEEEIKRMEEFSESYEKSLKADAEAKYKPPILLETLIEQTDELIKQNERLGHLTIVLILLTIIWVVSTILTQL